MLFIVRAGALMPCAGPSQDSFGSALGVVNAPSKAEAARILGLITWDGWKNIPNVQAEYWKKWGKPLFFTPFDTKKIDRNPKAYQFCNRRMRYITLTRTKELTGKISDEVWKQF